MAKALGEIGKIGGNGKSSSDSKTLDQRRQEAELIAKIQKQATKDNIKAQEKALKTQLALQRKHEKDVLQEEKKAQREYLELLSKNGATIADKMGASFRLAGEQLKDRLKDAIRDSINNITGTVGNQVNAYAQLYAKYSSGMTTRLQGIDKNSSKTFKDLNNLIQRNLSISPFVKQETMLENLSELVKEGINYNVEQRAFLKSVQENIASTFDVANGTLLQLVRIQQADSTTARMGMTSALNKFLNTRFQDTSYMNMSQDISSQLLGISSQLNYNDAVALDYTVQKWLGSLGSVGISQNTLTTLASGINALGTGDVSSLSGNTALQNLLVMGANRAGISYSEMLTKGLKADTTNALMQGIVSYMQSIASSDNQVVKAQYANLFNMTISDMSAILNLTSKDLKEISSNMLDYIGAVRETESQLKTMGSRMHMSEMLDNLFSNVQMGIAGNIANSPGLYATWMISDLIQSVTGGINIPAVSVLGTGIDLNTTVENLMKLGIVGVSTIGQIANIAGGLASKGGIDLSKWGGSNTTSRGAGFTGISEGAQVGMVTTGTSFSLSASSGTATPMYILNSSGSDIQNAALNKAYESAGVQPLTGKDAEDEQARVRTRDEVIIQHIAPAVKKLPDSLDKIVDLLMSMYTHGIKVKEMPPLFNTGNVSF